MTEELQHKQNFFIRKAEKRDFDQIYKLIKEFAKLENHPDSVVISAKELEKDGFGNNPIYECLVAENCAGIIIGYALYFPQFSTWYGKSIYLENLYISPECRGNGLGKTFLKEISKRGIIKEFARIDFIVNKSSRAVEFYERIGAIEWPEKNYERFCFRKEAFHKLPYL